MAVIQPAYFADLCVLAKAAAADVIIWADTFMYGKHTHNRARIKTASGPLWLTVPVREQRAAVREIEVDHQNLDLHAHARSLEVSYQNSPYYFFLADELNALFENPPQLLNKLCRNTFDFLLKKLRIDAEVRSAADLPQVSDRTERVMRWLQATGCDDYWVTADEARLIDGDRISENFRLTVAKFAPPRYHQLYGEFVPNLSGLDLLFNEGEMSRSLLRNALTKE